MAILKAIIMMAKVKLTTKKTLTVTVIAISTAKAIC
jgi:hypothetical protein